MGRLAFSGTGLYSYCVRGVDGSCAKHLTVESYMVIMLLTVILIIISISSPPDSFIPEYHDEHIFYPRVCVCKNCLRNHASKLYHIFYVYCLWPWLDFTCWSWNMLHTSGVVDDVIFL